MPELPEVETFKRYLDETSLNQIIKSVKIIDNRVLLNGNRLFFLEPLEATAMG
ncbi:MAG: DNA-formamidopyrimidine glycosylase family protein, partial [Candidatus Thorarchaeota archaeon]